MLIKRVLGRKVPSGGLPADVGAVVSNVSTAKAICDAIKTGMPLIERVVTVTGERNTITRTTKNSPKKSVSTRRNRLRTGPGSRRNMALQILSMPCFTERARYLPANTGCCSVPIPIISRWRKASGRSSLTRLKKQSTGTAVPFRCSIPLTCSLPENLVE